MNQDFWESPFGKITGKEDDMVKKSFSTIPNDTRAIATINNFVIKEYNGIKYYEIDWLLGNGSFQGRHVFQKIQAFFPEAKKRHKALSMLKSLFNLFEIPCTKDAPAENTLKEFIGRRAAILIKETTPNEQGKMYNWVSDVEHPAEMETATASVMSPKIGNHDDFMDDIPF